MRLAWSGWFEIHMSSRLMGSEGGHHQKLSRPFTFLLMEVGGEKAGHAVVAVDIGGDISPRGAGGFGFQFNEGGSEITITFGLLDTLSLILPTQKNFTVMCGWKTRLQRLALLYRLGCLQRCFGSVVCCLERGFLFAPGI
eukprot:TRINITY_DN25169_c0_g1_i1.p1 TRINITY_DN25169_c0_g1~~TRINITY_DN25169_c0_g1_i1.p1  ORF type:complete len:140 (-),score=5.19 TRINITY_DN25169_c0_g1_i1:297-716(-)